jgi:UDP-N-acetylmuramoyl-L-alanyl-D-glutamate--2,6-diaminopimelate ligase
MNLEKLLPNELDFSIVGNSNKEIKNIRIDSRLCDEDSLFFAMRGFESDGHQFITQAAAAGASAIVCEKAPSDWPDVTFVVVEDARRALAYMSRLFYHSPDQHLKLIAITGTNGKTSTASFIQQMLQKLGHKCGLIGTIHYDDGARIRAASHTTPESHVIYELMADMLKNGCRYVVMEVSSHALELNRVELLQYDCAIFLNFSQDHLDFHKTMDDYFKAKEKLFLSHLKGIAILNADDAKIAKIEVDKSLTFAAVKPADVRMDSFLISMQRSEFVVEYKDEFYSFTTRLVGKYNLFNLLASIASMLSFGFPMKDIQAVVLELNSVVGRMEKYVVKDKHIIIDYAHTSDALENLLKSVRTLCEGKLICVFGCGGDRDKTKRPKMAQAVEKYADLAIVTSDNPRREAPKDIIKDVVKGFKSSKYISEVDRKMAIFKALDIASENDLVIIAGKGHETYQEIQGVRYPFNDAEVIQQWS